MPFLFFFSHGLRRGKIWQIKKYGHTWVIGGSFLKHNSGHRSSHLAHFLASVGAKILSFSNIFWITQMDFQLHQTTTWLSQLCKKSESIPQTEYQYLYDPHQHFPGEQTITCPIVKMKEVHTKENHLHSSKALLILDAKLCIA